MLLLTSITILAASFAVFLSPMFDPQPESDVEGGE